MENGGHCFLPQEELIRKASEILLPQTDADGGEITNDEYRPPPARDPHRTDDFGRDRKVSRRGCRTVRRRRNRYLHARDPYHRSRGRRRHRQNSDSSLAYPPNARSGRRHRRLARRLRLSFRRAARCRSAVPAGADPRVNGWSRGRQDGHDPRDRYGVRENGASTAACVADRTRGQARIGGDGARSQNDPSPAGLRSREARLQARTRTSRWSWMC